MPASQTEYRNASARTTFQPYAGVRADYADTSYYEANFHRDKGEVSFGDVATAHRSILDYVSTKLNGWATSRTPTKPTSYRVYLSVAAVYRDGRQANRCASWLSFKTAEEALKHTDQSVNKQLDELNRIDKASV